MSPPTFPAFGMYSLSRLGSQTRLLTNHSERCLPDNPYVQMLKEDYGAECKMCTRPFTVFRWKADRTARQKKTIICLTCARLKQCCQCCMLDLMFGLPLSVRDAALKMVAPGPQSNVNREYYAQNHEREIEEGRGVILDAYSKTDDKARELLSKLANSNTYYGRQRKLEEGESSSEGQKALPAPGQEGDGERHTPGPVRTRDNRPRQSALNSTRGGRGPAGRGGRSAPAPIAPEDYLPPADPNVTSLFVTGVEDDLPEHELRTYFSKFGQLRSLVCSHRSHCAFLNFMKREGAENAAMNCQGKAVVAGVPLRVRWGKPKPLDTMDKEERMKHAREGRAAVGGGKRAIGGPSSGKAIEGASEQEDLDSLAPTAPPPGSEDVQYASLAGD
jgi:pre-mRNA-splicing factor RBM22/SLT11